MGLEDAPEMDSGLFEYDAPPPVSLADRFGVPPFSILDRRSGQWQDRRRRWLSLGIQSEVGRANDLISGKNAAYGAKKIIKNEDGSFSYAGERIEGDALGCVCTHPEKEHIPVDDPGKGRRMSCAFCGCEEYRPTAKGNHYLYGTKVISTPEGLVYEISQGATSVFDPVLCELAVRWYTAPGSLILDPFAGGSVRGIVAAMLQRHYMGVDLRPEQIAANREQVELIPEELRRWAPRWACGDSRDVLARVPTASADFVWSCPPYADLEVYSDDPRDLSTMSYAEFVEAHDQIVAEACRALKPNRFAAWVISDVRDRRGNYRGLGHAAVESFRKAGLDYYNEAIILDPVGSAAVRAGKIFNGGRKLTRMHQYLQIFVKGDAKKAARALGESELQPMGGEQ